MSARSGKRIHVSGTRRSVVQEAAAAVTSAIVTGDGALESTNGLLGNHRQTTGQKDGDGKLRSVEAILSESYRLSISLLFHASGCTLTTTANCRERP